MTTHALYARMGRILVRGVFRNHDGMAHGPTELIRVHVLHTGVGAGGNNSDIENRQECDQTEEPQRRGAGQLNLRNVPHSSTAFRAAPYTKRYEDETQHE